MPAPKDTPPFIAEIMTRCWNREPNRRPNVKHILQWLKSASKSPNIDDFKVKAKTDEWIKSHKRCKLPPLPPPAPNRAIPLPPPPGQKVQTSNEKDNAAKNRRVPPIPSSLEEIKKRPLPPPPPTSKAGANKLAEEFERKLQRRPPPPIPAEADEESDDDDIWDGD